MILWIVFGLIIGLIGFLLETNKSFENLFRNSLLGLVGAFQGMLLSNILQTLPVIESPISPLLLIVAGGLLLLSIGKISKKAF